MFKVHRCSASTALTVSPVAGRAVHQGPRAPKNWDRHKAPCQGPYGLEGRDDVAGHLVEDRAGRRRGSLDPRKLLAIDTLDDEIPVGRPEEEMEVGRITPRKAFREVEDEGLARTAAPADSLELEKSRELEGAGILSDVGAEILDVREDPIENLFARQPGPVAFLQPFLYL